MNITMNTMRRTLLLAGMLIGASPMALAAPGTGVGDTVKNVEQIEEFSQTGAESFGDLAGRAVLVEFFAYW